MTETVQDKILRLSKENSIELDNGCILWKGTVNNAGIPQIKINGDRLSLQRELYTIHKGASPDDKSIVMICRRKLCINHNHMQQSKTPVGRRKGRKVYPWREWFNKHEFTLYKGKEYVCSTNTMISNIRRTATNMNKHVTIINKDTHIIVSVEKE